MLRRLGIRAKVLAVLAVPMLVILAAGVFISSTALTQLRLDRATRGVVDLVQAYQPLSEALQTERVLSTTNGTPDQVKAARAATDKALADVKPVAAKLDLAEFPASVVGRFTELQRSFDVDLAAMRQNVDTQARPELIQNAYANLASRQIALVQLVSQTISNRDVAQYLAAQSAVAATADDLVQEAIAGLTLMNPKSVSSLTSVQFTNTATQTEAQRSAARDAVASLGVKGLEIGYADPNADYTTMRSTIGIGTNAAFALVDPATFAKAVTDQTTRLSAVSTGILSAGHTAATKAIDSQTQRAFITIGIAVGALVLSFIFAVVVSRTIVVPLRRLTAAAADVRDELPRLVEQVQVPGEGPSLELPHIPVTSSDEVGRLAAAFNAVNATTVQVAQEQAALRGSIAEMFVNVARRDQVLLNRQLSFIDSLERSEEDPSTLANLFRLDHLATRMRRNAESLLVLAGIDSGRRLRDSLPLSDVVRTASSEIEQYDRVELELTADPAMLGFNALPAAHLLAELLENATVFSEPETPIIVATGVRGDQVEVRIIDQGLGMGEAELAAANEKIRSVGAGDALGAQRLGLFVVGRLAQRLGAEVELRKSSRGATGTETVVRFPASLFQSTEVSGIGSYGSDFDGAPAPMPELEVPEVEPVDLAALTDGETPLGLPRRRAGGDSAAAPAPLPAAAEAAAAPVAELGAGSAGLPQRRKTFDENAIVLPEAPNPTLSPALSGGADWAPALSQAGTGLPSRTRAGTSAWAPATPGTPKPAPVADPVVRAGLFSGFRGRGDLAGAARPVDALPPMGPVQGTDAQAADGVAEADEQAQEVMYVPGLVPDDEVEQYAQPTDYNDVPATGPRYEVPALPEAYGAPQLPAWAPTAPFVAEAAAPTLPVPAAPAPAWDGPSWGFDGQLAAEPPVEPTDELPPAAAWTAEPVVEAAPEPVSEPEPEPVVESAAEPVSELTSEPVSELAPELVSELAPEPVAEPVPEPMPEPVSELAPEPVSGLSPEPTVPVWAAPALDVAEWAPVAQDVPVFEPEPAAFTSYSGFAGWSAPASAEPITETAPLDEPAAYLPFGRTADEAQAWTTGTIPVVPEPLGFPAAMQPAEDAAASQTADEQGGPADEWPQPAWQSPAWQPPTWTSPWSQDEQDAAEPAVEAPVPAMHLEPEPEPLPVARALPEPVGAAVPMAQSAFASWPVPEAQLPELDESPTQLFSPVEAADAVAAPAPFAPVGTEPAAAAPPVWQQQAAWAPTNVSTAEAAPVRSRERAPRRRGLFGRRRQATPTGPTPVVAPAPQAAAPSAPVRNTAWGPDSNLAVPPAPLPAAFPGAAAPAAAFGTPAPAPVFSAPAPTVAATPVPAQPAATAPLPPAPFAPAPLPPAATAPAAPAPLMPAVLDTRQTSWSSPEQPSSGWEPSGWAGRRDTGGAVPQPNPAPAPRVGALDDDVAAMLAMRSDIQEQALSELSQLSAYRPQVMPGGTERLTKRVPTAIPEAPEIDAAAAGGTERDPAQLRSRLSSFQSGTARGRRDAGQGGA